MCVQTHSLWNGDVQKRRDFKRSLSTFMSNLPGNALVLEQLPEWMGSARTTSLSWQQVAQTKSIDEEKPPPSCEGKYIQKGQEVILQQLSFARADYTG